MNNFIYTELKAITEEMWGEDSVIEDTPVMGIYNTTTARHGGYLVDITIHPELKNYGEETINPTIRAFEEDYEALKVLWLFPDLIKSKGNIEKWLNKETVDRYDNNKRFTKEFPKRENIYFVIKELVNELIYEHKEDLLIPDEEIDSCLYNNMSTLNFLYKEAEKIEDEDLREENIMEINKQIEEQLKKQIEKSGFQRDNNNYNKFKKLHKSYEELLEYLDENDIDYETSNSWSAGVVPSIYIKDEDGETIARIGNHNNRNSCYNSPIFENSNYFNWKEEIIEELAKKNTLFKNLIEEKEFLRAERDNLFNETTDEEGEEI